MARFAILSPPDAGHLYPLGAMGLELARRGHEVTVIARPKAGPMVEQLQLPFRKLEMDDIPWPSDFLLWAAFSAFGAGWKIGFRNSFAWNAEGILQLVPSILKELAVDGLVVDQVIAGGGTAAERAGVPFVTVCTAPPWNEDAAHPPPFTLWPYEDSRRARLRNALGYAGWRWFMRPTLRVLNRYRKSWGCADSGRWTTPIPPGPDFAALCRDGFSPQNHAGLLPLRRLAGGRPALHCRRVPLGAARRASADLRLLGHHCRSHEPPGLSQDCRRLPGAFGPTGLGAGHVGRRRRRPRGHARPARRSAGRRLRAATGLARSGCRLDHPCRIEHHPGSDQPRGPYGGLAAERRTSRAMPPGSRTRGRGSALRSTTARRRSCAAPSCGS